MNRLAIPLLVLLTSTLARATLGEKDTTIEADRKAVAGMRRSPVAHGAYTVHEIKSDGNLLREYVSSDGVVFAIAWKGVSQPDLSALLGTYFNDYQKAQQQPAESRRKARGARKKTQGEGVVVERSGHMRALHGRAYAPKLLPQGVNLNEIN